jgi:hypothetical protein
VCNAIKGGRSSLVAMRFNTGLLASLERLQSGRTFSDPNNTAQRSTAQHSRGTTPAARPTLPPSLL